MIEALASILEKFLARAALAAKKVPALRFGPSKGPRNPAILIDCARILASHRGHPALHLHHLDGMVVIAVTDSAAAVLEEGAFEAAVVGLPRGGVDA
jgi:hypothetical protein